MTWDKGKKKAPFGAFLDFTHLPNQIHMAVEI
jgi:hypothetical protein